MEIAKSVSLPLTPLEVASTTVIEHREVDELLANLYVEEDSMRVVLAEDKDFKTTPRLHVFLVDRVLDKEWSPLKSSSGSSKDKRIPSNQFHVCVRT